MKKEEKIISIPFPAWDGINDFHSAAAVLRHHPMLKGIPKGTPRRITIERREPAFAGQHTPAFDDAVKLHLWWPGGCYADLVRGGVEDESYGTQWRTTSMVVRWRDCEFGLPYGDDRFKVALDERRLGVLAAPAYIRRYMDEYADRQAKEAELAEAEEALSKLLEELAAPIREAVERQQAWLAKLAAGEASG